MAVLSKEEFAVKVLTEDNADEGIDTWVISAGSVVAMIAMGHESFEKDDIVEAIQALAVRMPGYLVAATTANIKAGFDAVGD